MRLLRLHLQQSLRAGTTNREKIMMEINLSSQVNIENLSNTFIVASQAI